MAAPAATRVAKNPLGTVVSYAVLALFTFLAVYPILYIVTISLRPGDRLLSTSLEFIPDGATLDNYRRLLTETPFLRWMGNSILITLVVTITGVALASTAGYVLSRYKFYGRTSMLKGLLVTQMFPATMLLLPLYVVLIKLQLLNSYIGLVVIYSATALPFCVWQMKGYYDTIPAALEEAARIDGCTPWQAFRLVVLPLAAPALGQGRQLADDGLEPGAGRVDRGLHLLDLPLVLDHPQVRQVVGQLGVGLGERLLVGAALGAHGVQLGGQFSIGVADHAHGDLPGILAHRVLELVDVPAGEAQLGLDVLDGRARADPELAVAGVAEELLGVAWRERAEVEDRLVA